MTLTLKNMNPLMKYKYLGIGKTRKAVRRMKERTKLLNKLKVSYLLATAIVIIVMILILAIWTEISIIAIELSK